MDYNLLDIWRQDRTFQYINRVKWRRNLYYTTVLEIDTFILLFFCAITLKMSSSRIAYVESFIGHFYLVLANISPVLTYSN